MLSLCRMSFLEWAVLFPFAALFALLAVLLLRMISTCIWCVSHSTTRELKILNFSGWIVESTHLHRDASSSCHPPRGSSSYGLPCLCAACSFKVTVIRENLCLLTIIHRHQTSSLDLPWWPFFPSSNSCPSLKPFSPFMSNKRWKQREGMKINFIACNFFRLIHLHFMIESESIATLERAPDFAQKDSNIREIE